MLNGVVIILSLEDIATVYLHSTTSDPTMNECPKLRHQNDKDLIKQ